VPQLHDQQLRLAADVRRPSLERFLPVPVVAILEHGIHDAASFAGEPADRLQTRPVVEARGDKSGCEPRACEHTLGRGQVQDRPDLEVREAAA
jgi:hypothetical protein